MQIKHLCTTASDRFDHRAVEIFPELNYLFRHEVAVDPDRYVRGGPIARMVGRWIVDRNRRGFHLVQVCKLVADFRAEQPSVVVGWGHEMCVTTFVAAAIARVPHIVFCIRTVNPDYGWTDLAVSNLLRRAHQRMSPLVSRIVVNSTLLRDDHARWVGIDPKQIVVCPNGIALESFLPPARVAARQHVRAQHGIAGDAVVITNVGRFSPEKGQMSLVEANRMLLERPGSRCVWMLCGDGPTLAGVRAAAERLGLTNMIFTGRTDNVRDILAASDIFVMPSDYEGMPNAMMEAMAAGLPCVSTTRSGARDVARDGVEALYYEPGDAGALAARITELLDHPDRARSIGAAAVARITEFTVPRFVGRFDDILDGLPSAVRQAS